MIDEMAKSDLDLVVAGTVDAVMMVESEAKELPEKQMLEAVMFGHRGFQPVIDAIIKLAEKAAKEPWDFQPPDKSKYKDKARALVEADLRKAFATPREAEAPRAGRCLQRQGQGAAAGGRERQTRRCCSAPCSRSSSRTSCAATSSRPRSASTAAT